MALGATVGGVVKGGRAPCSRVRGPRSPLLGSREFGRGEQDDPGAFLLEFYGLCLFHEVFPETGKMKGPRASNPATSLLPSMASMGSAILAPSVSLLGGVTAEEKINPKHEKYLIPIETPGS